VIPDADRASPFRRMSLANQIENNIINAGNERSRALTISAARRRHVGTHLAAFHEHHQSRAACNVFISRRRIRRSRSNNLDNSPVNQPRCAPVSQVN